MARRGTRLALIALAAASVSAAATGTVLATQGTANIAATRSYLRARHAYEEAIRADGPADQASAHTFVAKLRAGCPNVLAGAPPTKATEEIAREAGAATNRAFDEPQRAPSIAFARKIERLRWTNRRLTYYVRGFAAETRAEAELIAADVCSDARAVVASGYKTVPASTTRYIRAWACASSKVLIENSPGETGELAEIIGIMLKPYERPDEKALIPRRPSRREREARERSEAQRVASAESELERALGVPKGEPRHALGEAPPTCLRPPPR